MSAKMEVNLQLVLAVFSLVLKLFQSSNTPILIIHIGGKNTDY